MRVTMDCCGYMLAVLSVTLLTAWGGVYDAQSIPNDVQVTGTWTLSSSAQLKEKVHHMMIRSSWN